MQPRLEKEKERLEMRFLILSSIFLLTGCSILQPRPNLPTVLTSKDTQWTIPKGVEFQAIQKPAYPTLTKFVIPDDDLMVLYKGSYHDLETEADKRVAKTARTARAQGAMMGVGGSLLSGLVGLIWLAVKKKKLFKIDGNIKAEA